MFSTSKIDSKKISKSKFLKHIIHPLLYVKSQVQQDGDDCSLFMKNRWLLSFSQLFKRSSLMWRLIGVCRDMLYMVCSQLCLLIKSRLDVVLSPMRLLRMCSKPFLRFGRMGSLLRSQFFIGNFCEINFLLRKIYSSEMLLPIKKGHTVLLCESC